MLDTGHTFGVLQCRVVCTQFGYFNAGTCAHSAHVRLLDSLHTVCLSYQDICCALPGNKTCKVCAHYPALKHPECMHNIGPQNPSGHRTIWHPNTQSLCTLCGNKKGKAYVVFVAINPSKSVHTIGRFDIQSVCSLHGIDTSNLCAHHEAMKKRKSIYTMRDGSPSIALIECRHEPPKVSTHYRPLNHPKRVCTILYYIYGCWTSGGGGGGVKYPETPN